MQLADLTAAEIRSLDRATPVILPVAALEQHGDHLPVFTDSLLLAEIIRRTATRFPDTVLFAPLLWIGNSHHHLDFGGTFSASPRTYLDLLGDMVENLIHQGFRRIILLNGHGGNDVPGRQAVFELRQKHRTRPDLLLLFATYWLLGAKPREVEPSLHQNQMGHACEWETSMILRAHPHLVKEWKTLRSVEFGNPFEPAHRGWITQDRTQPGHIGSPQLATAEKGETLLQIFTGDVLALLHRVLQWDGKSWNG